MPESLRSALLFFTVALASCQSAAPPTGSSPAPAASIEGAKIDGDSPLSIARRLALAKAAEPTAIDREITRLQSLTEKQKGRPEPWVELGRAWVRKAREASDPAITSTPRPAPISRRTPRRAIARRRTSSASCSSTITSSTTRAISRRRSWQNRRRISWRSARSATRRSSSAATTRRSRPRRRWESSSPTCPRTSALRTSSGCAAT